MRFVHLSDFHIKKESTKDLSQVIIRALSKDLIDFNSNQKIDFIFFTGDLIDQGGKSFESIDDAFQEFEKSVILPLTECLDMDKGRFIFIPGNHDINRNADDEIDESGLSALLNDETKVSSFIDKNDTKGIKRILPYKQFEKRFHKNTNCKITNFHSSYTFNLNDNEVGISAFNTAWRCYDSKKDHGNILLGTRQITDSRSIIENCNIKIALMHHQFDFLKDFDMEAVKPSIEREYDLVFCGHVHRGSHYTQSDSFGEGFMSISPSNTSDNMWNDDQRYLNGYSIIDYISDEGIITVNNRKYSRNHDKYLANVELAPDNGVISYHIKKKEKPIRRIKSEYNQSEFDSMNAQLNHNNFFSEISTEKYHNAIPNPMFSTSNSLKFSKSTFFSRYGQEIFKKSSKYSIHVKDIEVCLLIMDKILRDLNDVDILNCIDNIDQTFSSIENEIDLIANLKYLFGKIKIWLVKLNSLNQEIQITDSGEIFEIMFPKPESYSNNDYVEMLLLASRETLNYLDQDSEIRILLKSKGSLIMEVILLFIFPVIVNVESFRQVGASRDINLIQSEEIIQILKLTYEEYFDNKDFIKGREEEINLTIQNAEQNKFTVVKGNRGVGKSSIISSVLEVLKNRNILSLIFSFKYSNSISEFVNSIIEQCNLVIINNIDMEAVMKVIKQDNKENKVADLPEYMILKPYFNEVIKRVVKENGKVFIIIDSLEAIVHLEDQLKYLLEDLPSMCSVIMVTGNNNECVNWLIYEGQTNIVDVKPFGRNVIPLFTNLSDSISTEKAINDKVYLKTKGYIVELIKITNSDLPITDESIESISNSVSLIDQEYIEVAESSLNNNILEESLLLFSIFEDIEPLSLDYIQKFLEFRGIVVRMPIIRHELRKIENQLSNMRFGRVRFIKQGLAQYLLTSYFSQRDVEQFIKFIFDWISNEEKLEIRFISEFIRNIESKELIEIELYNEMVEYFIDNLCKTRKAHRLYLIGKYIFRESNDSMNLPIRFLTKASECNNTESMVFLGLAYIEGEKIEKNLQLAEEFLRKASDLEDAHAKAMLGVLLFEENEGIEKLNESKKLLEDSAKLGNKPGKLQLATRVLIGRKFEQDVRRADQLFTELIEENYVDAIRIMGTRYLYGHWINRNIDEGKRLLNIAISKGSIQAKLSLAKYKVRIAESLEEVEEGISLLKELIENNNTEAKILYSKLLITGPVSIKDVPIGLMLLKELVDEGVEECELDYAIHLFNGEYVKQNLEEARNIISKLVERDYKDAKTLYGELLIDGEYYDKDVTFGLSLLIENATLGDEYAKKKLALRLAYGYGIKKDIHQAIRLLNDLADLGDSDAEYYLAKLLLKFKQNMNEAEIKRAMCLLEKAEKAGSLKAAILLGEIYLDGNYVSKDVVKGLNHINHAIELNDPEAMRELGYRYLYGLGLPTNEDDALQLLNNSINFGNKLAKTVLGHGIILGKLNMELNYGVSLLEEAANNEEVNAMRILGVMLIFGDHVDQNKKRGESLIRNAYKKGDKEAGFQLVRMMLDGVYLERNLDEGKKILHELIDLNYEEAIIEESKRLISGDGLEKNIIKGLEQLSNLSDSGNLDAKYSLARVIMFGPEDVPKDFRKGEKLLREAEAKNHEDARRFLAHLISDNIIKVSDKSEGIKLLEIAVKENDCEAMQILAGYYLEGEKVNYNLEYATELFERSIKEKNKKCMVEYGLKLIYGRYVTKDVQRGISLLQETVSRGYLKGKYELAKLYLRTEIIPNKYEEGLSLIWQLVHDGDTRAKIFLARSLVFGDKMEMDTEKSIQLFEELVTEKSHSAILDYAILLLDGFYLKKDTTRGEQLIRQLIQEGNQEAGRIYATRLIAGDGVQKHVSDGVNRLKKLAESGVKEAMLEYGIRLKKGNKVGRNITKARDLIRNAMEGLSSDQCHLFGMLAYKLNDYEVATELFVKAFNKGHRESGTSLAYMLRRNEVRGNLPTYSIYSLLHDSLAVNSDTAIINLALTIIGDNDSEHQNWEYADILIRNLFKCSNTADWWYESAKKENDYEGHLVIGWLVKHNIIFDPDNLSFKDRFNQARLRWNIPDWMMN